MILDPDVFWTIYKRLPFGISYSEAFVEISSFVFLPSGFSEYRGKIVSKPLSYETVFGANINSIWIILSSLWKLLIIESFSLSTQNHPSSKKESSLIYHMKQMEYDRVFRRLADSVSECTSCPAFITMANCKFLTEESVYWVQLYWCITTAGQFVHLNNRRLFIKQK